MSVLPTSPKTQFLDELERDLGVDWPRMHSVRKRSAEIRTALESEFANRFHPDVSLVVFGSVARDEVTSGSDLDWILLVDGEADPLHRDSEAEVGRRLTAALAGTKLGGLEKPGSSGVFGCLVPSHDLVHLIGGEDDRNSNTTRRVLLLSESMAVGRPHAYERVRRQILSRYVNDDRGLLFSRRENPVPRFLLNDITRYWRTVTVDFVYKQVRQGGKKWALRNAKLRMSRKLVFAGALLRCYYLAHSPDGVRAKEEVLSGDKNSEVFVDLLEGLCSLPALELLAKAVCESSLSLHGRRNIIGSYLGFLDLLDDPDRRGELELLTPEELGGSQVWKEIQEQSDQFQEGLDALFFGDALPSLRNFTREFGVF